MSDTEEWVLVPKVPTKRMLQSADGWTDLMAPGSLASGCSPEEIKEERLQEFKIAWEVMLEAAPKPPKKGTT